MIHRRAVIAGLGAALLPIHRAWAEHAADPADWPQVLASARGQTVHFHAWAGETRINDYIAWAGKEVEARYGITLRHVKVSETAAVVGRVLAEKVANQRHDGSVDLVWINGANFAAMKRQGLLREKAWAEQLPAWRHVDVAGKPTVRMDFGVPVEGLQAPWGMAQLVFYRDTARVPQPPRSLAALLDWCRANPGRFTYPLPPDFLGVTFLKQALYTLAPDPRLLAAEATDAGFAAATQPLFAWLDSLHPLLWRRGQSFPANVAALRRLVGDGEIDIGFTFNPADPSSAIATGELPGSVRSFVLDGGTIGNTHFLAIPFNAAAPAAAMVVADFLLSPEAQARKQDPAVWGDPTVLSLAALTPADRARFTALDLGVATLKPDELGPMLAEPHPSWSTRLADAWSRRYGAR
jgi:putative thiamine transport system substrate-binding protein